MLCGISKELFRSWNCCNSVSLFGLFGSIFNVRRMSCACVNFGSGLCAVSIVICSMIFVNIIKPYFMLLILNQTSSIVFSFVFCIISFIIYSCIFYV